MCGQLLEIQVVNGLPDPWALNYCMHSLPERNGGLLFGVPLPVASACAVLASQCGRQWRISFAQLLVLF